MEIVYCGGCGKLLRSDDFERGLARTLDNSSWCSECKPPDKEPIPTTGSSSRRQTATGKHARISVGTTRRETASPGTSRTATIGIGVAVVAIILLGILFTGNNSSPIPPTPDKPPRGNIEVDRNVGASAEAQRLLKELETLASLAPPEKILVRCEELRAKFVRLPEEKRFLEIQTAAKEQKRARDQEGQLTRELDALRKIIEQDSRYSKVEEVLRRFKAAREMAGPRAAEIDRRLADYQKERKEAPVERHLGPFFEDGQGFIRNWLILGVFPNDNDKGIDVDFLKTEAAHEPVADGTVDKRKWAVHDSPDWKIDFYRVSQLKIQKPKENIVVYAACLVQTTEFVASEFRMGSDDGAAVWVDGKQVWKNHKKRALLIDEDRHAVPLEPGVHRILVKVENHGGNFEFALRILTPDGKPLPGLKIWE